MKNQQSEAKHIQSYGKLTFRTETSKDFQHVDPWSRSRSLVFLQRKVS